MINLPTFSVRNPSSVGINIPAHGNRESVKWKPGTGTTLQHQHDVLEGRYNGCYPHTPYRTPLVLVCFTAPVAVPD